MNTCTHTNLQYKRKSTSPLEAVEDALNLIQAPQARDVFITTTEERAREAAKASQMRYAHDKAIGVLDGATVVWKDLFDQKGIRTTAGSLTRKDAPVATSDAVAVHLLEKAGACSLGKTTLSEFAFSGIGINPHFGTPSATLYPEHANLPGGSSSGSAVAVGLGLAQIGMGTDTGGSVRIPAAINGIMGFRPSSHRYSKQGVFPLSEQLDSVGTFARSVDDIIAVDEVLACSDNTKIRRTADFEEDSIPTVLDITDVLGTLGVRWDDVMYSSYVHALHILEKLGYTVKTVTAAAFPVATRVFEEFKHRTTLVGIDAKHRHRDLLQSEDARFMDPMIRNRMQAAPSITKDEYMDYLRVRANMIEEAKSLLGTSLLAYPTVPGLHHSKKHYIDNIDAATTLNADMLRATAMASFLDLPGIALPVTGENTKEITGSLLLSAAQGHDEVVLFHAQKICKCFSITAKK